MLKICRMLRKQAGFTLVELIIVIVILATLAGIALLNTGGADTDAKYAKSKADVDTLSTALKVYKMKVGAYPKTDVTTDNTTGLKALTFTNGKYSPMLDTVPSDPFGTNYTYTSTDGSTATLANAGTGSNAVSVSLK